MKARLPQGMGGGPQNMQSMLRQAQKMQENIEAKKAELEEKEYVVEVTANGKHEIKAIGINPEVVDPEDVEMLEDMLLAAINEAMRKIDEDSEKELSAVTGGLNIPGL